jgi:hypothetical protein
MKWYSSMCRGYSSDSENNRIFLQVRLVVIANSDISYMICGGKIGVLVPQLWSEGQLHPLTFKLANIVPQLSFLGQTRPYVDIILYNNIIILHNNMSLCKKSSLPLAPSSLNSATVYFLLKKYLTNASHTPLAPSSLKIFRSWTSQVFNLEHRSLLTRASILLRTHRE